MSKSIAETFALIERLRESGEDFCLATIVRTADATSAKAGAKAVVTADGVLHGYVGGACVTGAVRKAAMEALQNNTPRLIRVKPKEAVIEPVDVDGVDLFKSSCPSGGTAEIFLEPMRQQPRLVVFGLSPVSETLEKLGGAMGFETVIVAHAEDPRAERFSGSVRSDFDISDLAVGPRDAVVVATQGIRDGEALKTALMTDAGYIGMVGSRTKIARLIERLSDLGTERLARLHGPAGLTIGAIDPEEIALSILGEIVQVRRSAQRSSDRRATGT